MIITNIYYKKTISYLLAESKKESSKWRNYYYGESDYVITVHDFAGNIDIAIADAVDYMAEEQSTVQ